MRNNNIDCLRAVCAVLVACNHVGFYGNALFEPLFRCGVPCFFMISGYFLYTPDTVQLGERVTRSLRKIAIILLWGSALHLLFKLTTLPLLGIPFTPPTLHHWISALVLNGNPFALHLWYLQAYIYVLIYLYVANRMRSLNTLLRIAPYLLVGTFVFGKYAPICLGIIFPWTYTGNFFFEGLPFVALGMWLKRKTPQLAANAAVRNYVPWAIFLFAILAHGERLLLEHWEVNNPEGILYIGILFMVLAMMVWAVAGKPIHTPRLAKLGRDYSLYVYILHLTVAEHLHLILSMLLSEHLLQVYRWVEMPIVLVITVVAIYCVRTLWQKVVPTKMQ